MINNNYAIDTIGKINEKNNLTEWGYCNTMASQLLPCILSGIADLNG